jgi:hypothetical protein
MKAILLSLMLAFSTLGAPASMAQSQPAKLVAEFPASTLKWIRIAEAEFAKQKLDLENYRISVIEHADSVSVLFMGLDAEPGAMGNASKYPGYAVEIRKKDRKVTAAHYVR